MNETTNEWHRPFWWIITRWMGKHWGILHIDACLEFKRQDCWIGAFWKDIHIYQHSHVLHIWICVLPMLPLHMIIHYAKRGVSQ